MEVFDPGLMKLLTFLTRRQAWLSPPEIAREFRLDGKPVAARTIQRWFTFLREKSEFVYYPYPRANVMGLQEVLVRAHGVRRPEAFGILPFGSSFNVEAALGTGEPFISQGYWIPDAAMRSFLDYWRAAQDLGHLAHVEVFRARNTHFIFSPFEQVTREDGVAEVRGPIDNRYFDALLRRHLREPYEVRIGDWVRRSPLVVPIVVERLWAHYSSRQVWREIRARGEKRIAEYKRALTPKVLEHPGAALNVLHRQWKEILAHFDQFFLQPRLLFDWTALQGSISVSVMLRAGSSDRMVDAAMRASERAIVTHLKPGLEGDEACHLFCFLPSSELTALLRVVWESHRGREPPVVAIQDRQATIERFQPAYCKLDWRLFDPATLSWEFEGAAYIERLSGLKAAG